MRESLKQAEKPRGSMNVGTKFTIRMAEAEDWEDAITLAWNTFLRFEAEEYGQRGTDSFRDFVSDNKLKRLFLMGRYRMIVALDQTSIIGMITLRSGNHISLLFVDERYHRKGIGKALVMAIGNLLMKESVFDTMTVDASPYAVDFYKRIGFRILGQERESDGIRYTPMKIYMDGDGSERFF